MQMVGWMLEGYPRYELIRLCSSWGVTDRQIDTYMAKALEIIKEANRLTAQENLAAITSNLWNLYREAMKAKDHSEAHKVLNSIAKLRGLDKINIVLDDRRDLEKVSDEELNKMLEDQ